MMTLDRLKPKITFHRTYSVREFKRQRWRLGFSTMRLGEWLARPRAILGRRGRGTAEGGARSKSPVWFWLRQLREISECVES